MTVWPDQPPISRRQARISARGNVDAGERGPSEVVPENGSSTAGAENAAAFDDTPGAIHDVVSTRGRRRAAGVAVDGGSVPVERSELAPAPGVSELTDESAALRASAENGADLLGANSAGSGRRRSSFSALPDESSEAVPPRADRQDIRFDGPLDAPTAAVAVAVTAPGYGSLPVPTTRREIRRLRVLAETGMMAAISEPAASPDQASGPATVTDSEAGTPKPAESSAESSPVPVPEPETSPEPEPEPEPEPKTEPEFEPASSTMTAEVEPIPALIEPETRHRLGAQAHGTASVPRVSLIAIAEPDSAENEGDSTSATTVLIAELVTTDPVAVQTRSEPDSAAVGGAAVPELDGDSVSPVSEPSTEDRPQTEAPDDREWAVTTDAAAPATDPDSSLDSDALGDAAAPRAAVSPVVAVSTGTENSTNPYMHWTTMAALEDATQGLDSGVARSVGVSTGVITTHALVLPSIPESGDQLLASSLTNTGEVMVTGSIDLPRSFGSTGAHPALFDHPDVDALIEESDRDDVAAGSAPVRAIRAVSSHNSSRGVIESPGPQKSRLPFILSIVFGSVALVALGIAIASFVFQVR